MTENGDIGGRDSQSFCDNVETSRAKEEPFVEAPKKCKLMVSIITFLWVFRRRATVFSSVLSVCFYERS